jgi:hypothetical protein
LGIHDIIPPSEAAGIVADEAFMVDVMMVSASPEW